MRKIMNNSSDTTDSDEPKKHSIFDIEVEPAYISMYDKVKARSCKNMQKQEEEKRQEKIKAKFSQLKQSRAKREEKKRSTSWDEDSDSDEHNDSNHRKNRRGNKLMITSSSEDEMNHHHKKKIYSDSDSDNKKHNMESSDDDFENMPKLSRKGSKSRITSDTSDEEHKIKTERFSDSDLGFADTEEKVQKPDKIEKIKKSDFEIKTEPRFIFSDEDKMDDRIKMEPLDQIKQENHYERLAMLCDVSSDTDVQYPKQDRKKHKKKQKRPKNELEMKEHKKKDKKRDKLKLENKEKNRKSKSKGLKSSDYQKVDNAKRDEKMQDIFGPFSDDSENGVSSTTKELLNDINDKLFYDRHKSIYGSDSDSMTTTLVKADECKKRQERKEKKRKEHRRVQEDNDSSVDLVEAGRALEAKLLDDEMDETKKDDVFRFTDGDDSQERLKEICDKKENREKKKKRKKSKEEKHRKEHHHHRNYQFDHKDEKIFDEHNSGELPSLLDMPTEPSESNEPIKRTSSPTIQIPKSPPPMESLISPIPITPKIEKKTFIPGFGAEIDENIHENAVKSISTFKVEVEEPVVEEAKKPIEPVDKPRAVISQEETEDAVAALLGESFGNEELYNDVTSPPTEDIVPEDDDEEMRQAVQSLSACNEIEVKPETPLSENELQIDTDEEPEEDKTETKPEVKEETNENKPPTPVSVISKPSWVVEPPKPKEPSPVLVFAKDIKQPPPVLTTQKPINVMMPCYTMVPQSNPPIKMIEKPETPITVQTICVQPQKVIPKIVPTRIPITPMLAPISTKPQTIVLPQPQSIVPLPKLVPTTQPRIPTTATSPIRVTSAVTSVADSRIYTSTSYPQTIRIISHSKPTQVLVAKSIIPTPATTVIASSLPVPPLVTSTISKADVPKFEPTITKFEPVTPTTPTVISSSIKMEPTPTVYPIKVSNPEPIVPIVEQSTPVIVTNTDIKIPEILKKEEVKSVEPELKLEPKQEVPLVIPVVVPVAVPVVVPVVEPVVEPVAEAKPEPNISNLVISKPEPKLSNLIISKPEPVIPVSPEPVKLSPIEIAATELNIQLNKEKEDQLEIERKLEIEIEKTKEEPEIAPKVEDKVEKIEPEVEVVSNVRSEEDIKEVISPEVDLKCDVSDFAEDLKLKSIDTDSNVSVIKEIDRFDDDKTEDTESGISDMSKENMRLSADILEGNKDDILDSKEDSDYWSAKEVNIESVIKTVDALCSADELSEGSEVGKEDWYVHLLI